MRKENDTSRVRSRPWWSLVVSGFILLAGLLALDAPMEHKGYAAAGIVLLAALAYVAIFMLRRIGLGKLFEHPDRHVDV